MNVRVRLAAAVALLGVMAVGTAVAAPPPAQQSLNATRFVATLTGYEEGPAISTEGTGTFRARRTAEGIAWTMSFSGLEGGAVQQAHIHFGQFAVNGGVSAFLCSNLPSAPAGVQACPQEGTVSGTIRRENIVGPASQGIARGQLGELITAMRAGIAYANIHTATYPNGEIRGQIARRR